MKTTRQLEVDHIFRPSDEFVARANMADPEIYEKAASNPEKFWAERAQDLSWYKPWSTVLEWQAPYAKWFKEGMINACYNCVDRHVRYENGQVAAEQKTAIIWEGETGETRTLTYLDLYQEVNKCCGMLKQLGISEGSRVVLYMPMIPELIIACLACARMGALHSVVFAGLGTTALKQRVDDLQAQVIVTADFGWRRGKRIHLKNTVDQIIESCRSVSKVVVVQREQGTKSLLNNRERYVWWQGLMPEKAEDYAPAHLPAEHPLFVLYTSGTTGQPKGIVHTTGGYLTQVTATTKWVLDMKDSDVYFCTADIGWITGHSYVIYGPLACGATIVIYEGAPDWPDPSRWWQLIEKHRVSILYTAPTAIRAVRKWGRQWFDKIDFTSLRLLGSVGEPINAATWRWYHQYIGHAECPIVDTWWQTETGAMMIAPLPGLIGTKPGSATKSFPGIAASVLDGSGRIKNETAGYLTINKPWPAMMRTILNDDARYVSDYWSKWGKETFFTRDMAKHDKEGYFWLLGRADDVIQVAGHRISSAEIEGVLGDHPAVMEAAVVSRPDEIKGEAMVVFVITKSGTDKTEELKEDLIKYIGEKAGAIAKPQQIILTDYLPKTRSGKIMRRLLRDVVNKKKLGDTTTLTDEGPMAELARLFQ